MGARLEDECRTAECGPSPTYKAVVARDFRDAVPGAVRRRRPRRNCVRAPSDRAAALNAPARQSRSRRNRRAPAARPRPQRIIQHIAVQRHPARRAGTVLTYVEPPRRRHLRSRRCRSARSRRCSRTGLFSDVKINFDGNGTLTIRVVENPIINQVVFEGNDKVSDKDLTKEVQIKPRAVFTRAKVQADVQRIIELYRRNGKFAARVDPQIIQRPQNRVDLIFSINEGPTTGVARINFIGNKVFDDDTLKGQIATEESAWWKFLASNDNYDPDRLAFDREQLRRFYVNHGYADFTVVSAVAELTPDRRNFYVTFTVDEGPRYNFGKVTDQFQDQGTDAAVACARWCRSRAATSTTPRRCRKRSTR